MRARRVYVSSTSLDLRDHRAAVIAAVWRLGHYPVAMEGYVAASATPLEKCLRDVATSDLYVGIFGFRYGHVPSGQVLSITELEYRKALEKGIPTLLFLLEEGASTPDVPAQSEEAGADRIRSLRDEVMASRLASFFRTPEELASLVTAALALAAPRGRVVGVCPAEVGERFVDREAVVGELRQFLGDESVKFICIVGRGGVGKTWLLSKICREVETGAPSSSEEQAPGADGIVYVGCRGSDGPALERFYHDIAGLLESTRRDRLAELWRDPSVSLPEKVQTLIGDLRDGYYLLVLDNFERLLGLDNGIQDPEIRVFFEECLTLPHALRVLVTSRERIVLTSGLGATRTVEIGGIPEPDGATMLRRLDPAGEIGLREGPDELLREVVRCCHGIPRALEAFASILASDQTLTLPALLADSSLFRDGVVDNLVAESFRRLDPDAQRVMEALALYGSWVSADAVEWLLAPFHPKVDVRAGLRRLLRACSALVRPTCRGGGDLLSGPPELPTPIGARGLAPALEYSLHPIDQQYAVQQIPERAPAWRMLPGRTAFTKKALHARAAAYFQERMRRPETCQRFEELEEALAAFEHLVRAGMHDDAYRLLETFDFASLWLWGYYDKVVSLHEEVRGRLKDPTLQHLNLGNLGLAYWSTGRLEAAVSLLAEALGAARNAKQQKAISTWLGNLGLAHASLGRFDEALKLLSEALRIDRRMADAKPLATHLCDKGVVLRGLGRFEESMGCSTEGLGVARNARDLRVASNHLANLGQCRLLTGDVEGAAQEFQDGLETAGPASSAAGQHYNHCGLAACALLMGKAATALEHAAKAGRVNHPTGRYYSSYLEGLAQMGLHRQGESATALEDALQISRIAPMAPGMIGVKEPGQRARLGVSDRSLN